MLYLFVGCCDSRWRRHQQRKLKRQGRIHEAPRYDQMLESEKREKDAGKTNFYTEDNDDLRDSRKRRGRKRGHDHKEDNYSQDQQQPQQKQQYSYDQGQEQVYVNSEQADNNQSQYSQSQQQQNMQYDSNSYSSISGTPTSAPALPPV